MNEVMRKLTARYGHLLGAFAMLMSVSTAHGPCWFIFHQPVIPEAVKKLKYR